MRKCGRQWQVKVELMMPEEGAMLLLVLFLLTWQGNPTIWYIQLNISYVGCTS